MEQWLPVVGYEGHYEVSDLGRVRRVERTGNRPAGYVLRPRVSGAYPTVTLSVNSHQRVVKVHRLVAEAFLGPSPGVGYEVCHADDVKTNNAASNLRWDTHRNNLRDMVRNGAPHLAPRAVCRRGLHPMTEANTIKNGGGRRLCRACRIESTRKLKWMKEEGA